MCASNQRINVCSRPNQSYILYNSTDLHVSRDDATARISVTDMSSKVFMDVHCSADAHMYIPKSTLHQLKTTIRKEVKTAIQNVTVDLAKEVDQIKTLLADVIGLVLAQVCKNLCLNWEHFLLVILKIHRLQVCISYCHCGFVEMPFGHGID